jgi:5-carboxymethyl-2-hydroxymuconate isomerase
MPHCIIEHSKNVEALEDIQLLVDTLHQTLIDTGHFTPDAIKTRAKSYEHYAAGSYKRTEDFVHVTLYLLDGRDKNILKELSQLLFEKTKGLLPKVFSVSVDIQEMCKETYTK